MRKIQQAAVYLAELGFFPQLSGFGYLAFAIAVVAEDPMAYYSGRVNVLKLILLDYGVSIVCARRCMNYCIRSAWDAPGNNALRAIFPACSGKYPPALFEFICRAAIEVGVRFGE
ncbi:MAG: hypothetical protein J5544_05340 [Clostridia bacterium]|nr:hypothetical protein [Clostridia bacterium]